MSDNSPLACIILAAGKGTRMKSDQPKVMNTIAGRPIINWVLSTVESLSPEKIVTVIGPDMESLAEAVTPHETVVQKDRKGTGDAVKSAMPKLKGFKGNVLILLGDMPFIQPETLKKLVQECEGDKNAGLGVLGANLENPEGYGRLITGPEGYLSRIVEDKDASPEEKRFTLVNTGAFCVKGQYLGRWLNRIDNDNAQKEYYITDLPTIAQEDDFNTRVLVCSDIFEVMGVNSREQLAELEAVFQSKFRAQVMRDGVTLRDPDTVYFAYDTKLGKDIEIGPNVVFGPGVSVDDKAIIHPFCHLEGVSVGKSASVGPFARLRPGSDLGEGVRIGNFVEVKNSTLGSGAKANHLSYIGDATLGDRVNFSAGAITVNYDGFKKHRTTIGKDVMVGCNANLVAPLEIGDGAYIAAGSTITENVPADALSVARNRPIIRDKWAAKKRQKQQDK